MEVAGRALQRAGYVDGAWSRIERTSSALGTRIAGPSRRSAQLSEAGREARTRCPGLPRLLGTTYWQLLGAGAGAPGQGESWPTTGPAPWKGPEPLARNGKSPKLFGIRGKPGESVPGRR